MSFPHTPVVSDEALAVCPVRGVYILREVPAGPPPAPAQPLVRWQASRLQLWQQRTLAALGVR